MSTEYSKELAFELSTFKGLNTRTDPNKLSPGEFIQLDNIRVEDGTLKTEKTDGSYTMNLPVRVQTNVFDSTSPASVPNLTAVPQADTTLIRISGVDSTNMPGAYEPRTLFVAGKVELSGNMYGRIYTNSSANLPETDVTDISTIGMAPTVTQATGHQWMGFTVAPSAAISGTDYWIGFFMNTSKNLLYAQATASASINWKSNSSGSWAMTTGEFSYLVAKQASLPSSIQNFQHIEPLDLPFESYPITVSGSTRVQVLTSGTTYADEPIFSTIAISASAGTEYRLVANSGTLNQTLGASASQDAYVIPKTNIVVNNNIVAITSPNAGYCIPIGITNDVENFDARVYTGVLFYTGNMSVGGSQAGAGAVDLLNTGFKGFGRPWPGANPGIYRSINEIGSSLTFSGLHTVGNKGRMYYSLAGIIDSFTTNRTEIIDTTMPVLDVVNFRSSLIYAFSNVIKIFEGVPGYASLRELWPEGIGSKQLIAKTKVGVFFVFWNGLYLYNGSWNYILDLTGTLDTGIKSGYGYKYQIKDFPEKNEIIINLDDDVYTKSLVYSYKDRTFRNTTSIDATGIRSVNKGWEEKVIQLTNKKFYDDGTTYKSGIFETGWLDPDPLARKKLFDRVILSVNGTVSSFVVSATATFDNDCTASSLLDFGIDRDQLEVQWVTDIEAKKVKIKVETPAAAAEQASINSIKIIYTPTLGK